MRSEKRRALAWGVNHPPLPLAQAFRQAAMKALRVWVCFFSAFHCFTQSACLPLAWAAGVAAVEALVAIGLLAASAAEPPAKARMKAEDRISLRIGVESPWNRRPAA